MQELYAATPRTRDEHAPSAAFARAVKSESLPEMIKHAIGSNPNLSKLKAALASDLLLQLYESARYYRMRYTLAALHILIETREAGPDKLKTRNDGNSSYTHEVAQCHYALWTYEERDEVLRRVAELRTGKSLADLPDFYVQELQKQLDEELQHGRQDARMAISLLHDLQEDYKLMPEVLQKRMAQLVGVRETAPTLQMIVRSYDRISRRVFDSGEPEPMQLYTKRATDDTLTAEAKARDGLHNNATILRSGKSAERVEKKLKERDLFIRQVETRYKDQSVLLDYQCAEIRDQVGLIRLAMHTNPHNELSRERLYLCVDELTDLYRGTWLVKDIHPMLEIVGRIRRGLALAESMATDNQPAPVEDLALGQLAQPANDLSPPRLTPRS